MSPESMEAQTPSDHASGEALLKTDILAVFAHPDDETGMATTLAHYAHVLNKRITHVYATRGEGGGNMVGRHWGPALGLLRESELRHCLTMLGVRNVHFLNQRDWAYTESAQMTLESWDRSTALESLVRIIRVTRPDILLTMNPVPSPGQHGHHQAAGILAVEAFTLAANPTSFAHQIEDEGLTIWQTRKLYISGTPEPYGATIPSTASLADGSTIADLAGRALSHHKSQGFGRMAGAPWMARPRTYQLILSTVGFASNESDLFERINPLAPADTAENVSDIPIPQKPAPLRFRDRPAFERFRQWSLQNRVPILIMDRPVTLSLPRGISSPIQLVSHSPDHLIHPEHLTLHIPQNWQAEILNQAPSSSITIHVTPDQAPSADETLTCTWSGPDNSENSAKVTLHPLPHFFLPESTQPPQADSPRWDHALTIPVSHRQAWQGAPESDADISATVQIMWTREKLFVLTHVTDDFLVTNIQPDDIRGHWRSDSIEIAIDPHNGAEHTLQTFKVGIFPFTLNGGPRAARDADSNQGPIEKTAPRTKIHSARTTSGYRITTAIPWSEIHLNPNLNPSFAFNVLIYDGDNPQAQPGENINKSRLAISPANGVQGRPEDWARITLTRPN